MTIKILNYTINMYILQFFITKNFENLGQAYIEFMKQCTCRQFNILCKKFIARGGETMEPMTIIFTLLGLIVGAVVGYFSLQNQQFGE